jgi:4'-phosphopantetheinyl transferase
VTTRVWLCPANLLARDAAQAQRWRRCLSKPERERLERYRTKRQQDEFLSARALLRSVLASHCHTPPERLQFTRSEAGKPSLQHPRAPHFSLSHSGQWIALALDEHAPVGVDLEHPRKTRDLLAIAQHYFHPDEQQRLRRLTGPERAVEFYRLWTLKEAFFKARGTGIAEGLNRVCIAPEGTQPVAQFDPTLVPEPHGTGSHPQLVYQYRPLHINNLHLAVARAYQSLPLALHYFKAHR